MRPGRAKRAAILVAKLAVSVGLLWWLVQRARADASFAALRDQPKEWWLLVIAWIVAFSAVLLTFLRWMLLVRALGLPFRIADAMRLGFLGYLFNFVSLGSVGGDIFKAVFLAREHPGRRTEAVATVVVDRVVGLYSLLLVASVAVLFLLPDRPASRELKLLTDGTLFFAALGAVGLFMLVVPGFTGEDMSALLGRIPAAGHVLVRVMEAIRIYRRNYPILLATFVMSIGTHVLFTVAIFLIARGLPGAAPTLADHFFITPLAMLTGALPLPLAGLGAFEGVLDYLYRFTGGDAVSWGKGLVVALAYRAVTIVIATVGLVYYLTRGRDVVDAIHEAEDDESLDDVVAPTSR